MEEYSIPCYDPANGESVQIETRPDLPCKVAKAILENAHELPDDTCMDYTTPTLNPFEIECNYYYLSRLDLIIF